MKNKIKIIINIFMTIFFIILMGYHITGNKIHEYLGVITLSLVIIHNCLNIKWYKNIAKGKYNLQRIFLMLIDLLLLIVTIGIAVSSMIISSEVFDFLNIQTTMFGRRLHMLTTSWGFILISAHIGLHLNGLIMKFKDKLKNSTFEYVYYFILLSIILYGGYSFITTGFWENMFLLNDFSFFEFDKSPIIICIEYITILIFVAFIIYGLIHITKNAINKLKKEEKMHG